MLMPYSNETYTIVITYTYAAYIMNVTLVILYLIKNVFK